MQIGRKVIRTRRKQLLALVAATAGAVILFIAVKWLIHDRNWVVTDNAFVTGNIIPVYSDATGVVAEVFAEETQNVKKGDVLVRLDGQRALAALAQAEAELGRAVRSVGALFAARGQACEKIVARTALREKTRHDVARYRQAAPSGSVSRQVVQNAEDQLAALDAELREVHAEYRAIEARVGGVSRTNHPDVETAKAKFTDAYIEVARQKVKAPASGYVAKRKAQVGQRVRAGDQLLNIVPLDHLWVEANLWENRMERVRPGQPAIITVDLYGKNVTYHGAVEGVVPGSGSVFATLPPDNATGNFIHIVQRVPVRIALRADEIEKQPLRPGLSTVTSIDVSDVGREHNASIARIDAGEYRTDIYENDLAEARTRGERTIRENIVGAAADGAEAACAAAE